MANETAALAAREPVRHGGAALGAIALAAALWALAAIVASDLFDAGVTPIQLTAARAAVAAAGFAVLPASWRGRRTAGPRARSAVLGMGVALALVTASYYAAIERLPVAIAIVLQYTAPALVVVATAVTNRRPPSGMVGASLAAALAGVALLTRASGSDLDRIDGLGVAFGLASAAFFAAYTMLGERARRSYGSLPLMLRAFSIAALIWIAVIAFRGWPAPLFTGSNLGRILFVGIGGTLVPFLLYIWAVAHVLSERAAIAATLEPVLAALGAWIWLDQELAPTQLVGGMLVIAAVASLARASRPEAVARERLTDRALHLKFDEPL